MKEKSKYIIDVTQLVHQSGGLTGIPRVIDELTRRFVSAKHEDVTIATWVKEVTSMCEIDFEETMKKRGSGIIYKTYKGDVKPAKLNLKLVAKKVAIKTKIYNSPIVKKIRANAFVADAASYVKVEPKCHDILVVPAGEWWDAIYRQKIQEYVKNGVKLVQIIHDMLPIIAPQFSGHATESFTAYCREVAPIATLILTVSENTKRDLQKWLKAEKLHTPKIQAFRLGEDFYVAKTEKPKSELFKNADVKGDDFILCACTLEIRKNHQLLYYVYKLAKQKNIKLPKLLLAGRQGWHTDDVFDCILNDPDVNSQIFPLLEMSSDELSWLYSNALFSIYPSFYEGWGMPIAESISRGVPCIASGTSSMLEVAPDFTDFFSPASTDECLNAIIKMSDVKYLKKKRELLKKYKPTTWDMSFRQVDKYMKGIE
jgi:glycosyltransferase involved in cell wall biosynthesis